MIYTGFLGYPDVYAWLHDWLPIIFMGLLLLVLAAPLVLVLRRR